MTGTQKIKILTAARAMIAAGWVRPTANSDNICDARGYPVDVASKSATRWNICGALEMADYQEIGTRPNINNAKSMSGIAELTAACPVEFDDKIFGDVLDWERKKIRTMDDVLALFDAAIAHAGVENA